MGGKPIFITWSEAVVRLDVISLTVSGVPRVLVTVGIDFPDYDELSFLFVVGNEFTVLNLVAVGNIIFVGLGFTFFIFIEVLCVFYIFLKTRSVDFLGSAVRKLGYNDYDHSNDKYENDGPSYDFSFFVQSNLLKNLVS